MNLFLIHQDVQVSCHDFALLDPLRARKQLLEACQLLASVDHLLWKDTGMLRQDGSPYKEGYIHHPITRHMTVSKPNYLLAVNTALALALVFPTHACSRSVHNWMRGRYLSHFVKTMEILDKGLHNTLCVCRRGEAVVYVDTLTEYAEILHAYLRTNKWATKPPTPLR